MGSILKPDFASKGGRSSDTRIGEQERIESAHETSDAVTVEREAPRHAHESVCLFTPAQLFGEERPEIGQISGDDRALLSREHCEVNAIGPSPQISALADSNDVVTALSELARDL